MKTCLFSVSYAGLWGQHALDLEAFLRKAAGLGYDAVELMAKRPHLSILDYDSEGALAKVKSAASEAGVAITTLAGYNDFTCPHAAEVPLEEMQIAYIGRLCRMARALGAGIVRVFTGYTTDPESYAGDWRASLGALRECGDIAREHGVVIGVQNHHDVAVGVETYEEFLRELDHPSCKAMFDPWSAMLQGADLHVWARRLAPLMVQTTLADYVCQRRFRYAPGLVNYQPLPDMVRAVAMGEGQTDWDGFFSGLKEGGFDGVLAYEMCSPLRGGGGERNLDAKARAALEMIQRYW
jgi:sugar phosphate isomerase/epimerase